jgi:hypothetical protein
MLAQFSAALWLWLLLLLLATVMCGPAGKMFVRHIDTAWVRACESMTREACLRCVQLLYPSLCRWLLPMLAGAGWMYVNAASYVGTRCVAPYLANSGSELVAGCVLVGRCH